MTTPTWPARDENGSTNGAGVLIGVEVSAATGAATPTITVSYTNSAGSLWANGHECRRHDFDGSCRQFLSSGVAGGRRWGSVGAITHAQRAWISGTINLVAYRLITTLDLVGAYTPNDVDILTGGMPQLFNGSVPFLVEVLTSATTGFPSGLVSYTQG